MLDLAELEAEQRRAQAKAAEAAGKAVALALATTLCCGILTPLAFLKGQEALTLCKESGLHGTARLHAWVAMVISVFGLLLWLYGVLVRLQDS